MGGLIKDLEQRAEGKIESFNVAGMPVAPGFPYKHVTVASINSGYLVTLSGMLGFDERGKLAEGLYGQSVQAIKNIQRALEVTIDHCPLYYLDRSIPALSYVMSTRVDLQDLAQVSELNRAYVDMGMPFTARTAVEVAKLPRGALVEITTTAFLPRRQDVS